MPEEIYWEKEGGVGVGRKMKKRISYCCMSFVIFFFSSFACFFIFSGKILKMKVKT